MKETEQRAAELAVINSVQEGMAAELDFQAIIDLVGDKLREVFALGDMGIGWVDEPAGLMHFRYLHGAWQAAATAARRDRDCRGGQTVLRGRSIPPDGAVSES